MRALRAVARAARRLLGLAVAVAVDSAVADAVGSGLAGHDGDG